MEKTITLSTGAKAHIYETSLEGVHIIDVYKDEKLIYSLYDSGREKEQGTEKIDSNKIDLKEVQEIKSILEDSI